MRQIGEGFVLAVILSADFYARHRGWEGLGVTGVVCAALWFWGMSHGGE